MSWGGHLDLGRRMEIRCLTLTLSPGNSLTHGSLTGSCLPNARLNSNTRATPDSPHLLFIFSCFIGRFCPQRYEVIWQRVRGDRPLISSQQPTTVAADVLEESAGGKEHTCMCGVLHQLTWGRDKPPFPSRHGDLAPWKGSGLSIMSTQLWWRRLLWTGMNRYGWVWQSA